MSAYRTEINIPVNKDHRTMEQRRNETFQNLERRMPFCDYSNNNNNNNNNNSGVQHREERMTSRTISSNHNENPFFNDDPFMRSDSMFNRSLSRNHDNYWDRDVNEWINDTRRRWNEETDKMRRSMFSLESDCNIFDFNKTRNEQQSYLSPRYIESNNFPRRSPRELSPINTSRIQESRQQSTFSSNTGSSSPYSTLPITRNDNQNCYELGDDGQLYFKIRFDAPQYRPEDIKITQMNNQVNLTASNKTQTSFGEYQKTITVPVNVDSAKFQCHLTTDGVLVLEAPVLSPEYSELVPVESNRLLNSSKSDTFDSMKTKSCESSGPVISIDSKGQKKMRLELTVDPEYETGDFSVKAEAKTISLKGRHELKTATSSSFKEFSRSYTIIETIDPMSVIFKAENGLLTIEANVQ